MCQRFVTCVVPKQLQGYENNEMCLLKFITSDIFQTSAQLQELPSRKDWPGTDIPIRSLSFSSLDHSLPMRKAGFPFRWATSCVLLSRFLKIQIKQRKCFDELTQTKTYPANLKMDDFRKCGDLLDIMQGLSVYNPMTADTAETWVNSCDDSWHIFGQQAFICVWNSAQVLTNTIV